MTRTAAIRTIWLLLPVGLIVVAALPAAATGPTWEHWQNIPGVFDVAGPRSDGTLVVAGTGQLYSVDPAGAVSPFAGGPQGYAGFADAAGAEAYLTVSPGHQVSGAGCSFMADDVFVLRLHAPLGITRIDAQGNAAAFATVTGVDSLNGIAFDTTGKFGFRLLASGPSKGKTVIAAIDCTGAVQLITSAAPVLEGGLAVAPSGFGAFGGDLIAPDEYSGKIFAIGPDGTVSVVAASGLPVGPDTGVEGVAFVPPGFTHGGEAYYADRATAGNPHPGTNSLLRLSSSDVVAAGVHDGDLLAATEGGGTMIAVSCQATCQVATVVGTTSTSHGEGHIAFTINKVSSPATSSPATSPTPAPAPPNRDPALLVGAFLVLCSVALAIAPALRERRARGF